MEARKKPFRYTKGFVLEILQFNEENAHWEAKQHYTISETYVKDWLVQGLVKRLSAEINCTLVVEY